MRTRAERWSEGREGGGAKDVPLFLVTLVDDGPAPTFPRVRRATCTRGGWARRTGAVLRTRAERWSEGRKGGGAKDVPLFSVTLVDDGSAPTVPQVRRAWLASSEY